MTDARMTDNRDWNDYVPRKFRLVAMCTYCVRTTSARTKIVQVVPYCSITNRRGYENWSVVRTFWKYWYLVLVVETMGMQLRSFEKEFFSQPACWRRTKGILSIGRFSTRSPRWNGLIRHLPAIFLLVNASAASFHSTKKWGIVSSPFLSISHYLILMKQQLSCTLLPYHTPTSIFHYPLSIFQWTAYAKNDWLHTHTHHKKDSPTRTLGSGKTKHSIGFEAYSN